MLRSAGVGVGMLGIPLLENKTVSWFLGFKGSWFLGFKDSWFLGFLVSWFQTFLVSRFQRFKILTCGEGAERILGGAGSVFLPLLLFRSVYP